MVGTLNSRQDYNSHAFLLLLKTCRTATIGSLPPPRSSFPSSVPLNTWYFSQEGRAAKPCCRNHPLQAVQQCVEESHQRSGGTQEGKSQNRNPRLASSCEGKMDQRLFSFLARPRTQARFAGLSCPTAASTSTSTEKELGVLGRGK